MAKRYSKGDVINGYTVLQDFRLVGQCQWSFAAKGGKDYFIKEFLEPIYPLPSAPGSEKTKAQQRKECEEFEKHHTAIMNALKGKSVEGDNLVITLDFFREGARYYKTTSKIDIAGLTVSDVAKLPPDKRILVLRTVTNSLQILHRENIVHGDLKPDNILIKKSTWGNYIAKLIDFDSSYFSTEPAAEVVGDPVYYTLSSPFQQLLNNHPPSNPYYFKWLAKAGDFPKLAHSPRIGGGFTLVVKAVSAIFPHFGSTFLKNPGL
jgi:serine/threonine protein kinase